MSKDFAGQAENRNLFQFFLHNPFKIHAQPAVKNIDVIHALVIGCNDVRRAGLYIFRADDMYGHRSEKAVDPCPDDAPNRADARRKQQREDDGKNAADQRRRQQQRQNKKPLVGLVAYAGDPVFFLGK